MMLSNPALLEKIDTLRELNIGQHVPLPQVTLESSMYVVFWFTYTQNSLL